MYTHTHTQGVPGGMC